MKRIQTFAVTVGLTLMECFTPLAEAFEDIRSEDPDEVRYIRVRRTPERLMRFELCDERRLSKERVAQNCTLLGTREYTVFELRRMRGEMRKQGLKTVALDIGFVAAAAGVALAVPYLAAGGAAAATATAAAGGAAAAATAGGIGAKAGMMMLAGAALPNMLGMAKSYLSTQTNPISQWENAGRILSDDMISDRDVRTQDPIGVFAKQLDEHLKAIP